VFVPLEAGGRKRLATFSAGMVFGEMAVIDRAPRSATIVADSEVECDALSLADIETRREPSRSNQTSGELKPAPLLAPCTANRSSACSTDDDARSPDRSKTCS
jgi:hypothetical protein